MVLLVLGLIFLLTLVLMLLGTVFTIFMITRYWNVLRPIAVSALLLLGGVAFFDALASTHAVRCAEKGAPGVSAPGGAAADDSPEIRLAESSTTHAEIPLSDPQAPAWTRRTPGEMNTAQEVVEITVHAGPCLSRSDCETQLGKAILTVVDDFVRTEIATTPGVEVTVSPQFIEKWQIVPETYVSRTKREVVSSLEPQEMVDLYALVRIDRTGRAQLRDLWRESIVQRRMKTAGATLVGVLAVLTLSWAILRRPAKSVSICAGQ